MGQEVIPVAEFKPDMPDLAEATYLAQNVVPITPQSYGPLPAVAAASSSGLDSQCLGTIAAQGNDGVVYLFAGTADKLWELTASDPAWTDVSLGTYNVPSQGNWNFEEFLGTIIATDFTDPMQSFNLATDPTFGPLFRGNPWSHFTPFPTLGVRVIAPNGFRYTLVQTGTSGANPGPTGTGVGIVDGTVLWDYQSSPPPLCKHICTPKGFLMAANTSDPVGGLAPGRVWWSSNNDPTSWPAPGTNQAIQSMSDFNDFVGDYGGINGIVDSLANADVSIFFENAVWRGLFVGPPAVFDFFPVEGARGCPAPNSIVTLGTVLWYLGTDGFYFFDGAQSTPIGNDKFDAWFWGLVDKSRLNMVIGAANVPGKMIMWAFASTSSPDGLCDTLLIYRWDIQRASYANLSSATIEWIMRSLTFGINMDDMALFGYTDVDTLPYSLDSPFWVGGSPTMSVINNAHQLGYFTGPNMAAQVATQTKQLTPGRRSYVRSARPLVDLTSMAPTIAFAGRTNLYDPISYGSDVAPDISGECPQRNDNRYHNALIKVPSGAVWTHIIGVDSTFTEGGFR